MSDMIFTKKQINGLNNKNDMKSLDAIFYSIYIYSILLYAFLSLPSLSTYYILFSFWLRQSHENKKRIDIFSERLVSAFIM